MNNIRLLFLSTLASCLLWSCFNNDNSGELDITSAFKNRWNIRESVRQDGENGIIYDAVKWGGIIGDFVVDDKPADWSQYGKVVVDFSKPTPANTQLMLNEKVFAWGKRGITSLEGNFAGLEIAEVKQLIMQCDSDCTINIKRIYLLPASELDLSTTLWEGRCVFGNWTNGFEVKPDKFADAKEGDMLEIVYTTDTSKSDVTYWQIKTIYAATDVPLEGNAKMLNEWGCATVGKGTTLIRITLTKNDAAKLKEKGLYVNGYFTVATQCNLLQ